MKFTVAATLVSLAAGTIAAVPSKAEKRGTPVKRDIATVTNVINSINSQVANFDTAIKAYNGGDTSPLQSAASAVLDATNQGTQTVTGTSSLSDTDALTLQPLVNTLTGTINTTINDLVGKKQQIVAAGGGGQTEDSLSQQQTAAQNLAKALASKVPPELQGIATSQTGGIQSSIQNGVTAFQGTGGSASGSPSGSSPAPTGGSGGSGGGSSGGNATRPSGSSSAGAGSPSSSSSSSGSSSGAPFKGADAGYTAPAALVIAAIFGIATFAL